MLILMLVVATGWVSYYASPALFPAVIYNRQHGLALDIGDEPPGTECYAAARTAGELDSVVYIRSASTDWIQCWVVDVAGVADGAYQWMVDNKIWYEVDPVTMLRLRGSLGGGVRVRVGRKMVIDLWDLVRNGAMSR